MHADGHADDRDGWQTAACKPRGRGSCLGMFITGGPGTKLCAGGKGESEGHVLRDTTSRGLGGGGGVYSYSADTIEGPRAPAVKLTARHSSLTRVRAAH